MYETAIDLEKYEVFEGNILGKKGEIPNGCWNCDTKQKNKIGWHCSIARRQVFPLSWDGRLCSDRPRSN